jgi:eukaryotic-like serine/threonine-protein kinase
VLLATPAALFDTVRPESEPRADYLRAVEKRLVDIANKFGRDKIAVDFVQIDTHPRKQ